MDSFGPVRVPSIYHNFTYANIVVHDQSGAIFVDGSTAIPEPVLERAASAFRTKIRPYVGQLSALRTDSIRQTTTSKRWAAYANGSSPFGESFVAEHATGGKHYPIGAVERINKEAWPRVLAALKQQRRGLKWWWVCFRHAVLLIEAGSTRRNGTVTSRFKQLYGVPFNQTHLRVILSPCQYYVSAEHRDKVDDKARNGLWCGFSPDNSGAAWIWSGKQFVTVEHGDVRTNEWVAWSLAPVGTLAPGVVDAAGDFALFDDNTAHTTCVLLNSAASDAADERVTAAAAAAIETNLTVRQAAHELGFSDSATLTAAASIPLARAPPPGRSAAAIAAANIAQQLNLSSSHSAVSTVLMMQPSLEYLDMHKSALSAGADMVMALAANASSSTAAFTDETSPYGRDLAVRGAMLTAAEDSIDVYANFPTTDAYDDRIASHIYAGMAHVAKGGDASLPAVRKELASLNAFLDDEMRRHVLPDVDQSFLGALVPDEAASTADALLMLVAPDDNGTVKRLGVVGFCGAMVTLYDDHGNTYTLDEPENWQQYLKSKFRSDWERTLVQEVTKLEDMNTWTRVPRSAAKGVPIHKCKVVWRLKTDGQKRLDKRKARVVIVGVRFNQGMDYLEHYSCGASFAAIRVVGIVVTAKGWILFKADVTNAFPHEKAEVPFFMELPDGPFDWSDPVTGERQIGLVQQNLYGTPPAPRTFTKGAKKHHVEYGFRVNVEEDSVFDRDDAERNHSLLIAGYVDEFFGGANNMDAARWYEWMLKKKYQISVAMVMVAVPWLRCRAWPRHHQVRLHEVCTRAGSKVSSWREQARAQNCLS